MKNLFEYYNDTYGSRVLLFIGTQADFKESMASRKYIIEDIPQHTGGETFYIDPNDNSPPFCVIWMPKMEFITLDYVTLSHECGHVAMDILNDRQMKLGEDSINHAFLYLKDAIYGNLLSQLNADYNQYSK